MERAAPMSWSSFFASGRNLTSYAAGVVSGVSLAIAYHLVDGASADALLDRINQLSVAITALAGIMTTAYTAFRAWRSASPEQQQAAIIARGGRAVLEFDPKDAKDVAKGAASISNVKTVVTSQVVADAIPLDKVVGPDQAIEVTK